MRAFKFLALLLILGWTPVFAQDLTEQPSPDVVEITDTVEGDAQAQDVVEITDTIEGDAQAQDVVEATDTVEGDAQAQEKSHKAGEAKATHQEKVKAENRAAAPIQPSTQPIPLKSANLIAPKEFKVNAPERDSTGLNLILRWTHPKNSTAKFYAVLRSTKGPKGPWEIIQEAIPVGQLSKDKDGKVQDKVFSLNDKLTTDPSSHPPEEKYWYQVVALGELIPPRFDKDGKLIPPTADEVFQHGIPSEVLQASPRIDWLKTSSGALILLAIILAMAGLIFWFTKQVRAGHKIAIRRIPGIDAIEEGIGRATEMGRPVLYVPGIDELQDIQTIASMLILGEVSRTVAEYQTEIIVACAVPMVREVADEVIKAGHYQAGFPDAYQTTNTRFIAADQFAFCAGTNGIMYRQKPATNIYFGRFFAESLILAETGYVNKSIQVAGTAETSQLPFFIAACDYTLIGEELFAVSAYLSNDPRLVSSLKASDWIKIFCVAAIVLGTILETLGVPFHTLFVIGGS